MPDSSNRLRIPPQLQTLAEILAAGLLMAFAMGPWGWWPLAFIGVALLLRLLKDQSYKARVLRSFAVFSIYFLITMNWVISLHLVAWPGLSLLQAAMLAPIVALTPATRGRWLGFPAALMLAEAIRWSWPFGGVPLSNIALTQVNGPLLPTARLFTALTVVGLLACAAVAIDAALSRQIRPAAIASSIVVVAILVALVSPDGHAVDTLDASLVQGGGELGTHAITSDEVAVFERHFERTLDVPAGTDLVLWPEDVLDVEGHVADSPLMHRLQELTDVRDFVLVVGVVEGDGDTYHNASVVIDQDGEIFDRYDKVNLVPFGEYVPFRSTVERFVDLSRLPRDATPGEGPGLIDTPYGRMGIAISFEIFFPRTFRSGVTRGGNLLLGPTNSSSYTNSMVPEQTLASSRLRSVENGRWMVQASPTGYGAFIDPKGAVTQRSGLRESIVLSQEVELREGETLSVRFGQLPLVLLAVFLLAYAWRLERQDLPPVSEPT